MTSGPVGRFIDEVVAATRKVLGERVVGIYLVESLAQGDARPEHRAAAHRFVRMPRGCLA